METIRKQATKLREQVAKQQQAVLKQFSGGSDNITPDETEFQQHKKLEKLYISTHAAKHFQRDVARGVEGYILTGSKQVEIGTKLSDDNQKYGSENTCTSGNRLSRVALCYSRARIQIEKQHDNLLRVLGTQVSDPLKAMVMGTPLEDARHIAQKYDRAKQEVEAQVIDIARRQARVKETKVNSDNILKLEAAETKLHELKSNMVSLGKEAAAGMAAVEHQQQRLTLHRLIAMVEAEKDYHQNVLQILDQLEGQMLAERQPTEAPTPAANNTMSPQHAYAGTEDLSTSRSYKGFADNMGYFLGEVIHAYQAETDVELTLAVGDYVVVRKVSNNGWAEGECKGKAGWFPFGYIERRERIPASKVAEVF
ncbi:SH3 domain-containing protein 2-like [Andrographis paniculata]|uniref:SH3 domain-containing protein 2-like n=1 Tax=Andrographis paniculata TaxID=175694 RepID=UPI0021E8E6AF|nr:SH3 domain-containing protein 2-like [Andrographis paniculata]